MKSRLVPGNESGTINALLLPLIAAILLLIGAVAFGAWAYGERQTYKDHAQIKINEAVTVAQKAESAAKEKEFLEREKNPLKTYTGPAEFGSVNILYPKTWSGYVADDGTGTPFVDGYFSPGVVPNITADTSVFAVRVQVVQDTYSSLLEAFSDEIQNGDVKVTPYSAPKVPRIVGSRVEGKITDTKSGTMILIPLRDKTLQIWTEAAQYQPDFDNIIMANLTFSP